jgi:hypothetical protein
LRHFPNGLICGAKSWAVFHRQIRFCKGEHLTFFVLIIKIKARSRISKRASG